MWRDSQKKKVWQREWQRRNKAKVRAYSKKYRDQRTAKGICTTCPAKVTKAFRQCRDCRIHNGVLLKASRARKKEKLKELK